MNKFLNMIVLIMVMLIVTACSSAVEDSINEANVITEETTSVENEPTKNNEELSSKTTAIDNSTSTVTSSEPLKVHFIDVGQGDSILIESPSKKFMLIDGGVKGEGKKVVEYLRNVGVKELQYVVATHPDADHIGGLISVLNSIKIKNFVDSGKVHTSQTYEEMLALIDGKNIRFSIPKIGDVIKLDKETILQVVSADENASDNNEASIVLKLQYGEISYLLMGDVGIEMEQYMMANIGESTILKAGHHGSNTSSSAAFINKVKPKVAILSYGQNNKYGHPHAEVIENLRNVQSKIYGTAEVGTIIVSTDGKTYNVNKKEWTGIGATSSISYNQTKPAEHTGKVEITNKDLQADEVTITNNSKETVSLNGWKLLSVEGNQTFNFPNISLKPGKSIIITSGPDAKEGNGYIKWTGRAIWLNDGDAAKLFNEKGEIVSELD